VNSLLVQLTFITMKAKFSLLLTAIMGFTTVLGAPAPTGFYNSSGYEELPSPFVRDSQGNQYIAQRGQLHNPGSHHEQYTTAEQFLRNPTMDSPMYRMLQSAGYHVDLSSSSNWPVHESRHAPYIGHQQGGYQGHGQQEQYRPPQQMMNGYPGSQSGAYQGQGQQFHQQFSGNIHGQGQDQFNHAMSNHGHGQGQSRAPNSGSHQMHPGSASHHSSAMFSPTEDGGASSMYDVSVMIGKGVIFSQR
jgi:hypothetical protein